MVDIIEDIILQIDCIVMAKDICGNIYFKINQINSMKNNKCKIIVKIEVVVLTRASSIANNCIVNKHTHIVNNNSYCYCKYLIPSSFYYY